MTRFSLFFLGLCCFAVAQPTVENGIELKGKNQAPVFKEVVRIGDNLDDDNYFWRGTNSSVSVGPKGHVFVSDAGGSRVLEYDGDGHFVRLVGAKGNGPGEYQGAPSFFALSDGSGLGFDAVPNAMPKFNTYDTALKFKNAKVTTGTDAIPAQIACVAPDGSLIGGLFVNIDQAQGKMMFIIGFMNRDMKLVKTVMESPRALPNAAKFSDPSYWADYLAENLSQALGSVGRVGFDGKGRIYTANSDVYEITRWSADGKTKELVFNKKYKPIPFKKEARQSMVDFITEPLMQNPALSQIITKAVINKAVDKTEFPPAQSPVLGLIGTQDGHLLVVRDMGFGDGVQSFDYFDEKGVFIGTGKLGESALFDFASNRIRITVGKNKAWSTTVNEDGGLEVVGYALTKP